MKRPMNLPLKMAMHESRRTQKRIATLAKIDETRLSKIVRGRKEPTVDEMKALARVLGKAQDELFPSAQEAVAS